MTTGGTGTVVGVRMLDHPACRGSTHGSPSRKKNRTISRPEAIRRLVELGLKAKGK